MASMAFAAFAGIGAAAAAAAPVVSTAATVLGGVATAGSVLMGIQQAQQTANAGRAAAQSASLNAELSQLEGERQATQSAARAVELRRDALRKVGAARVAFGASGLDISSGQLAGIEGALQGDANYGLALERDNERIALAQAGLRTTQFQAQAGNAISSARSQSTAQLVSAGATGARGLLSIARRG